jgi:hypothetical protein
MACSVGGWRTLFRATLGLRVSQWASGWPNGIPTLPAFTTRLVPTFRSNCMWVWPQTTRAAPSPAKTGKSRLSGVKRVKHSFSFRGVAWQKSTSPNLGKLRQRVLGHAARNRWCSGSSCSAVQRMSDIEILQALQCFKRHRAWQHIAANHNTVDFFLTNFPDYGFERREVRVNVIDCRDSHERTLPRSKQRPPKNTRPLPCDAGELSPAPRQKIGRAVCVAPTAQQLESRTGANE